MKVQVPGSDVEMEIYFKYYENKLKVIKCYIKEDYMDGLRSAEFQGVAKCHPDDEFNKEFGERLALMKALEKRSNYIKKILHDATYMLEKVNVVGAEIANSKFHRKWRQRNAKRN